MNQNKPFTREEPKYSEKFEPRNSDQTQILTLTAPHLKVQSSFPRASFSKWTAAEKHSGPISQNDAE